MAGGVQYADAQFDDAGLALALAQTFAAHGGAPLNYARVRALQKRNGRVSGALVHDEETAEEWEISARVVINATGVFCDEVRAIDEPQGEKLISPSQGAHLVLPGAFLPGKTAILIPETSDGRVLFAIPWQGRVLLGTTDVPVERPCLAPRASAEEIDFLVSHAASHLAWSISSGEVLSVFAGLRPLIRKSGASRSSQLSRDHLLTVSRSGLVSIAGGKWTTYRRMAEETVNVAARAGGLPVAPCRTADLRLAGRAVENESRTAPESEWIHPRLPFIPADFQRAAREEMARTVEDALSRRTRCLLLDARASAEAAPVVARLLALELGRDASWESEQVTAFRRVCAASLA